MSAQRFTTDIGGFIETHSSLTVAIRHVEQSASFASPIEWDEEKRPYGTVHIARQMGSDQYPRIVGKVFVSEVT
jgi:hypothetical protein